MATAKRTMDGVEMVNDGCPEHLIGKHMGGVPVESLPPSVWRVLTAAHTDEGIAAAKAGAGVGIVGNSDLERKTKEWGDALKSGQNVLGALDPMRDMVNRANIPPGMTPKLLSVEKLKKSNTPYAIARDASGDPVKSGDLVVGFMPTELVQRSRKELAERAKGAMQSRYRTNAEMSKGADPMAGSTFAAEADVATLEELGDSGFQQTSGGFLMDPAAER